MKVFGITGMSGIGKTTFCQKIIKIASMNNLRIEGFISPAIFQQNKKIGINVVNIANGEARILAELNTDENRSKQVGQWRFIPDTFKWVENFTSKINTCDIFIADEIGPLEIELGKGWVQIFDQIDRMAVGIVLFSFRPKFIEYFTENFPGIEIIDLSVSSNEDLMNSNLLNRIENFSRKDL